MLELIIKMVVVAALNVVHKSKSLNTKLPLKQIMSSDTRESLVNKAFSLTEMSNNTLQQ